MEKSNLTILLAFAGFLCLFSQGFVAAVPVQDQDAQNEDGTMKVPIDEILRRENAEVPEQVDGGFLTEYDIMLTPEQHQAMQETDFEKRTAHMRYSGRWPNAKVNYEFKTGVFTSDEKNIIRRGMAEISHYTCVTFEENYAADRVQVIEGPGCSSWMGMKTGVQTLKLSSGCRNNRSVVHEFLHALGMMHEQTRFDRDEYVTIHFENINENRHHNFAKGDWFLINNHSLPYDYDSITHYSGTAFTNNGNPTIVTKDSSYQKTIGTIPNLSMYDIRTVNSAYSCVPSSCQLKVSDCIAGGWVGKDCTCWCPGKSKTHPVEYCFQKDYEKYGSLLFK